MPTESSSRSSSPKTKSEETSSSIAVERCTLEELNHELFTADSLKRENLGSDRDALRQRAKMVSTEQSAAELKRDLNRTNVFIPVTADEAERVKIRSEYYTVANDARKGIKNYMQSAMTGQQTARIKFRVLLQDSDIRAILASIYEKLKIEMPSNLSVLNLVQDLYNKIEAAYPDGYDSLKSLLSFIQKENHINSTNLMGLLAAYNEAFCSSESDSPRFVENNFSYVDDAGRTICGVTLIADLDVPNRWLLMISKNNLVNDLSQTQIMSITPTGSNATATGTDSRASALTDEVKYFIDNPEISKMLADCFDENGRPVFIRKDASGNRIVLGKDAQGKDIYAGIHALKQMVAQEDVLTQKERDKWEDTTLAPSKSQTWSASSIEAEKIIHINAIQRLELYEKIVALVRMCKPFANLAKKYQSSIFPEVVNQADITANLYGNTLYEYLAVALQEIVPILGFDETLHDYLKTNLPDSLFTQLKLKVNFDSKNHGLSKDIASLNSKNNSEGFAKGTNIRVQDAEKIIGSLSELKTKFDTTLKEQAFVDLVNSDRICSAAVKEIILVLACLIPFGLGLIPYGIYRLTHNNRGFFTSADGTRSNQTRKAVLQQTEMSLTEEVTKLQEKIAPAKSGDVRDESSSPKPGGHGN